MESEGTIKRRTEGKENEENEQNGSERQKRSD